MGCIYSNFEGKCTVDIVDFCCYEDDPDPSYSCESYESDYYCSECGIDLNVKECECDV